MKIYEKYIDEAAYHGNIGFQEMVQLYQVATPSQLKRVEKAVKNNDWNMFMILVKEILGIGLKKE